MGAHPAWCFVVVMLAMPMTAGAQTGPPDDASLTRIEVGAGLVTGISIEDGPGGISTSGRARFAATPRTAFEVVVDVDTNWFGLIGTYEIALHRSIGRGSPRAQPFLNAGVTGFFQRLRISTQRMPLPTGETLIIPAWTKSQITGLQGVLFGGGMRLAASRRVFFEPEARLGFVEGGPVILFNFTMLFSLRR